jgi:hypothetical protein
MKFSDALAVSLTNVTLRDMTLDPPEDISTWLFTVL